MLLEIVYLQRQWITHADSFELQKHNLSETKRWPGIFICELPWFFSKDYRGTVNSCCTQPLRISQSHCKLHTSNSLQHACNIKLILLSWGFAFQKHFLSALLTLCLLLWVWEAVQADTKHQGNSKWVVPPDQNATAAEKDEVEAEIKLSWLFPFLKLPSSSGTVAFWCLQGDICVASCLCILKHGQFTIFWQLVILHGESKMILS